MAIAAAPPWTPDPPPPGEPPSPPRTGCPPILTRSTVCKPRGARPALAIPTAAAAPPGSPPRCRPTRLELRTRTVTVRARKGTGSRPRRSASGAAQRATAHRLPTATRGITWQTTQRRRRPPSARTTPHVRLPKLSLRVRRDEGDDAHATRVRRSDTSRRVFDDYALSGRHTEFRGGSQVGLWVGFATRDIIRRDEDRGNGYACVPEPRQGGISRTRSCNRPCIGWKRAQELGGTLDRHHAIGVDGLTCVEASCFRFGGQM